MSGKQLEFAREWLEKAQHDLFAVDKMASAVFKLVDKLVK